MKEETEDASKGKEPLSEREKKRARQDDAAKRAAGHLPPEMDESTGKMINPHNPEFITKVPWYLGESGPTLKHHADQKSNYELSMEEADNLYARKHATQVLMKGSHQKVGYRKGGCKNCGAMTHKEKDCVERPRSKKKAAVNSGLDIAHDEVMLDLQQHGKVGYSAKRDGWQGYDASEYQDRIDKYERIEAERRRLKKEEKEQRKLADAAAAATVTENNGAGESNNSESKGRDKGKRSKQRNEEEDSGSDIVDSDDESVDQDEERDEEDEDDDEDKTGVSKRDLLAADDQQRDFQGRMARQGGVGGNQMMVTARNLRIREDKPKYLRNLDLDSAHYDPKSRSMRANPTPGVNPADLDFAGDNFARQTGDAVELAKAQVLCWEMEEGGGTNINSGDGSSINPTGVDIVSNPSQAALITKQYQEQKAANALKKRAKLAAQYGDASTITAAAVSTGTAGGADKRRLLAGQSEAYMEYEIDASGRVVVKSNSNSNNTQASSSKGVRFAAGAGGAAAGAVVTKYEEDVLEGNHTAVWGSYFDRNNRQWGYACCWSVLRGSYCTGEAGKKALMASSTGLARLMEEKRRKQSSSSSSSAAPVALGDDEKMKAALERAKHWQQQQEEEGGSNDTATAIGDGNDGKKSKKRKEDGTISSSSSGGGGGIDEPEDMEEFRVKRNRADDPMAHYRDIGE